MGIECTFYDPATGAIDRVCELSQETLRHYAEETDLMFLVLTDGDKEAQYVVDGALVNFTHEELAAKRAMLPGWAWLMPDRIAVDQRTLDATRAAKITAISASCAAQITSGFDCDALGKTHHYPFKANDQLNLTGSIIDSLIPDLLADWTTPFWCADPAGVWQMRPHTAAQIQQVGRCSKVALLSAMTRNDELITQIMGSTIAQIDLIHW